MALKGDRKRDYQRDYMRRRRANRSNGGEEAMMETNSNEMQRWAARFQRKLDSMALTKGDREELEEMLAIVVNLSLRQVVQQPAVPQEARPERWNGGNA